MKDLLSQFFCLSLLTEYNKINQRRNYMANKRKLKKGIQLICEDLFAECVAVSLYGPVTYKDNAEALLYAIVKMQDNFIKRISHPEPGISAKVYYKDLREKFSVQISEILDQINA